MIARWMINLPNLQLIRINFDPNSSPDRSNPPPREDCLSGIPVHRDVGFSHENSQRAAETDLPQAGS